MRILLFEKNTAEAEITKNELEKVNIIADMVSSKEDVISMLGHVAYDLFLIGIIPPGKEEKELIGNLIDNEIFIPVLYIPEIPSSEESPEDHTLSQGILSLLNKIEVIMAATEGSRGAKITFGQLILDPISHKVWRNNKEINLTPKEYTLLEFFIRHPNQILTRTMIANHVWNQNFDFFTNVIDVYINYLRKKVDIGFEKKLIHTVRGKGYILKEE